MRIYLLAMVFQASNLLANHPDCGKQERERVGSSGSGHSTGAEASILKHPWAVAIMLSDELHCSGSILSEKYVLTAAHCFVGGLDQSKMTLIAGSEDPANPIPDKKLRFVQKRKIDNVKKHPLSNYPAAKYDLALVKIKGQFTFRNSRWPICIPEKKQTREYHFTRGYVMLGFGRDINKVNKGSVLTELDLDVQPTIACSTTYGRILNDEFHEFHFIMKNTLPKNFTEDSLLCASKPGRTSGSCPGDSGGILMRNEWVTDLNDYRNIQTAVVHGAAQKCNGGRYPAIFVRIDTDEALSWINEIAFSKNSDDGNCRYLKVTGDTFAACTGTYRLSEEKASNSPNYPVYKLFKNDIILCGNHYAESCAGCPQGNGANWCGGWCQWSNEKCILDESRSENALDRYIWHQPGEYGWRISSKRRLSEENEEVHFYRSSITKKNFWTEKNIAWKSLRGDQEVKVECVE